MAENKDNKKPQGPGRDGKKGAAPKKGGDKHASGDHAEALKPSGPPRLKTLFDEKIRAEIGAKFGLKNPMSQPRLDKIVLNVNMGKQADGGKIPPHIKQTVIETLTKVTGQKPVIQKSKKSVSNFKLRAGMESSAMVTIRRERMWHFLDRLINLASPRIKDFRGLPRTAFDKQGNYAMGINEQGVFPEINMAEAQYTHGMNINFTFRNSTPELSRFVLEQMGFPFAKPEEPSSRKSA
jgi:large subunit ribosomal protein L5